MTFFKKRLSSFLKNTICLVALSFGLINTSIAEPNLTPIQHRWAEIKYQLPAEERQPAYEKLVSEVEALLATDTSNPKLLIWRGIVLSTYAGEKGGLGALKMVKQAKADFEQAISIDDKALSGAAYTSLGALYYQVPGWPIGFGDKKKANEFLQKALAVNPDGLDSNFFYGDFLISQKKNVEAMVTLKRALNAPDRPDRPLADKGRRQEVKDLLTKLEK